MKLVLYFADAFAWKYVEDTDYMADFFDERRPLETVLGYSSTILPVLGERSDAARHGYLDGVLPGRAAAVEMGAARSLAHEGVS